MENKILILITLMLLVVSCNKENTTPNNTNSGGGTTSLIAPTQSIPANGATNISPPVTFSWSSVPNSTSYDLTATYYIGNQPGALAHEYGLTTNSYTTISNLQGFNGVTIYWQVRADNGTTTGSWSPMWSFTFSN